MPYVELPPPPDLAGVVHCLWRFDDLQPGALDRIVPDGRCELIVHGAAPFSEHSGRWRRQPRVLLAGRVTRPLHLRANGAADVIGVRLRYAAARPVLARPMHEATDRRVDLTAAWGEAPATIDAAIAFVRKRAEANAHLRDALVEACVDRIARNCGALPVEALAQRCGIGRRQLERRFANAVGIGPALLASILRFRRVFDEIDHGGARRGPMPPRPPATATRATSSASSTASWAARPVNSGARPRGSPRRSSKACPGNREQLSRG